MYQPPMTVYLSGEIHSDWRERIAAGIKAADLPIQLVSPVLDHDTSDKCGVEILGAEEDGFWADKKGSNVNALRTRVLFERADIVVVRFGDKYKQWNAAFDAGQAAALNKPYITLHDEAIIHPLKEANASALASARTPEQVVQLLTYAIKGEL